ncbi:uncharacterized protein LOC103047325 [Astyanax mexicanus]|uniref:uncharacterized protein LOC103047325 n=1 Tax=Astyanax mexicanus TaxID=7994 RepID=UPI0020CB3206|nr:uncharacterized protein LOC103047325 [Astyanax mexicanus]
MPRSREISEDVRKKVVEAHQSGKGYKLISKALGLSKTTIRAILQKWKTFGTVMNLPRSGRPPKISPKTRREIIREVKKNPCTTSKDVQAALAAANISVHDSTIRRLLGIHGRPTLSEFKDVTSLRSSSDEMESTLSFGKLSDSSNGFRKDVKVEDEQQDLVERDSKNDGGDGALEKECCTLGQHSDNCDDCEHEGAGDPSGKCRVGDDADSNSSSDNVYKYDDEDDDDDEDGSCNDNDCEEGDANNGESCDEESCDEA